MKYGLKEKEIDEINKLISHYPQIDEAILYGSRAMGNFKRGSDIDLTLKGQNLSLATLLKLGNDLDDTYLPYLFDLSNFDQIANPDLVNHINRVGIIFYKKRTLKPFPQG